MDQRVDTLLQLMQAHPRHFRCHHIAGVFRRKTLVTYGVNLRKTHPLQERFVRTDRNSLFIHAEIAAIYKALKHMSVDDLKKHTLIVLRYDNMNKLTVSRPCSGCLRALALFQFKEVWYSTGTTLERL